MASFRFALTMLLAAACGSDPVGPAPQPGTALDSGAPEAVAVEGPVFPAWGELPALSSADARAHGLLAAELARDPHAEAIGNALSSGEPAWVDRAVLSLARIGGAAVAQRFVDWLGDGARRPSAAMLGAIAALSPPEGAPGEATEPAGVWALLEANLWTRYALTEDPRQAEAMLLAIARTGGKASVRKLAVDLAALPTIADADRFERGAEALAILCVRRQPLTVDALAALAQGLTASQVAARRGSAYALSRCAGPSAERLAGSERGVVVERLGPMLEAADEGEALAAWRALESLGESPAAVPASVLGASGPPWQVEVAAVRALGASATGRRELSARLGAANPVDFEGPRVHVLLEALRSLRAGVDGTPELLEPFAALRDRIAGGMVEATEPRRRKELTLVHCEFEVLQAVRSGALDAVKRCATAVEGLPAHYGELLGVEALLLMGAAIAREERIELLLAAAKYETHALAAAAIAGLADIDDPRVNPLLRGVMQDSADVGMLSAAAGAIVGRAADRSKRDPEAVGVLQAAVKRLSNDTAVEARIEAIRALGSLARSEAAPTKGADETEALPPAPWLADVVSLAADPNQAVRDAARSALAGRPVELMVFDAALPKSLAQGFSPPVHAAVEAWPDPVTLMVTTSAGAFRIDFSGAPAPIAQANFAALADRGYFDGLSFHRVVPAFVVQGGDPRGDGYGGPGHVMPCEWSNARYERGTVGVALAGKDTGGSQLFITHGAPHHLDGRYAVIGRVVEGLEVVDALLPYDAIIEVQVVRAP